MSYKENLKRWYITFYSVTLISKGCRGRIIPNFTELEVLKKMIDRMKQKLLARVEWEPLRDKIGRGLWFWIFGYSSLLNTFLCKYYLSQPGCRLFALKKKKEYLLKRRHTTAKRIGWLTLLNVKQPPPLATLILLLKAHEWPVMVAVLEENLGCQIVFYMAVSSEPSQGT